MILIRSVQQNLCEMTLFFYFNVLKYSNEIVLGYDLKKFVL